MINGQFYEDSWEPGFFDDSSFCEIKQAWARSVVTGRARLGGIPVGVIAAETRSFKHKIPADPANEIDEEITIHREGKVLYSDSTAKVAQAISDFSREELPLFIFPNWWGYSGNLKDTYEQILKFQQDIVEGLKNYSKPVFVYLPPHAELRGSAWLTFDSQINPDFIEMYADPDSNASVLDPESIVEMKYKNEDYHELIHRLDGHIKEV